MRCELPDEDLEQLLVEVSTHENLRSLSVFQPLPFWALDEIVKWNRLEEFVLYLEAPVLGGERPPILLASINLPRGRRAVTAAR